MTGFFTGGGKSLSFGNPQDPNAMPQFGNRWRGGRIIEEGKVMPQTDINTGAPILGPDGRAKEQLALPLQADGSGQAAQYGMPTDERNVNDQTDTGRRVLYIKGSLRFAVGDAIRAAGATDLQVGGELYVMWTGMGKTGNSKFIGRTWKVKYFPPTGTFFGNEQPQAPAVPPNPYAGATPASAPAQHPNPAAVQQPQGTYTMDPNFQMPTTAAPPAQPATPAAQPPAAPSNPWGGAPEQPQPPQAPYGQPQTPATQAPAPTSNPWG